MNRIVVLCCVLFTGMHAAGQQATISVRDNTIIKQLFFEGLKDKLNENYEKSNESFSRVAALDPGNAAAWYEIALLNFRQNKMPEAEAAIKTAVKLDRNNLWYWKLLAELYKTTGNMAQLIPAFDQLIRLSPEQKSFYFDRANALSIAGKKEEALAAYDLLEKKFGTSASINRAKQRIAADPLPADSMAVATLYAGQKNFTAAARILKNIAPAHLEDPLYFALSGDILYESGNLPGALRSYKKALKISDQLYGVWEKVLNIHILLGQYKQMIEMGEAALSVYPNQAILYYYMAFALHREEQNDAALGHIKTALSLDGENKELQALIFALKAEILIDERKPDAADVAFEKAVMLDPQNYLIMNNYAYYLALRNENLNKAVALIDVAARALPDDASIADTYALILLKGGKYAVARTWIEKALENKEAENSVYLEHYGDILFLLGEPDNAVVQWKKSRDAGNDSTLLKRKIDEKKYFK
ncbi:Tetratricopeptide repeat-containing protein [Pedobacter westerhofensis]|uniref:Tetratricopeptide repeat-containing protein n=1 Tax=Pedobacter westerhofensis TaxID=425512 RepID=A0A521C3P9_9SPHI|nr:tetratricopeptide repeat protein [Pedobacter westerhofensis]SMO54106.1 Tetratricopeptide repeat-containing protein [Pedobacter westerhofensis]